MYSFLYFVISTANNPTPLILEDKPFLAFGDIQLFIFQCFIILRPTKRTKFFTPFALSL
jgi:hypothetical protein